MVSRHRGARSSMTKSRQQGRGALRHMAESWCEDKQSTCWSWFPYFTWVTCIKLKKQPNTNRVMWHSAASSGERDAVCDENWVIISSLSLLIQNNSYSVSLFLKALFRWVLHCSPSHVYRPKPQCEIRNNCSPELPWHSPAHCCSVQFKQEVQLRPLYFSLSYFFMWQQIFFCV